MATWLLPWQGVVFFAIIPTLSVGLICLEGLTDSKDILPTVSRRCPTANKCMRSNHSHWGGKYDFACSGRIWSIDDGCYPPDYVYNHSYLGQELCLCSKDCCNPEDRSIVQSCLLPIGETPDPNHGGGDRVRGGMSMILLFVMMGVDWMANNVW